jgi:UPF0042 nucleotide-binding protein
MERLVVITGLAGSGKTLAADCFEDLGYFCVDNLPVSLIPPFCELIQRSREQVRRAVLVIDAREGVFLDQFPEILRGLRERQVPVELLFFDCSDELLKRRFSESRRPHPVARAGQTLEQAFALERQALRPLREMADRVIDTSRFTPHELRTFLRNAYDVERSDGPKLSIVSFGFKYGLPTEADLVFDVRFLPNPHFDESLRPLDGLDSRVQQFLDGSGVAVEFLRRLEAFLEFLVPLYAAEGKSYLTVAIGCTGGKHRSVALAEKVRQHFTSRALPVAVHHRDLGRE